MNPKKRKEEEIEPWIADDGSPEFYTEEDWKEIAADQARKDAQIDAEIEADIQNQVDAEIEEEE